MAESRMKGRVKGLLGGGTAADDDALLDHAPDRPDPDANRALHVLTLAQRTADEHVATAQHQAGTIRADAQAAAEQLARDAQAQADRIRRDAEKVLSDARAMAQKTAKDAQANAAGLEREAQQRYDDVVGSLAAKREALQEQIEALQQFERDHRSRLTRFMQAQLRALGADELSDAEIHQPDPIPTSGRSTSAQE